MVLDLLTGGAPPGVSSLGGPGGGSSDPSQQAFASGILAGAGLREISQVLGLSRRRQQRMGAGGAMPSSGQMLQGNIGDMDRILLLAKLQGLLGGAAGPGGPSPIPPLPAQLPIGAVPPVLPIPAGPLPLPGPCLAAPPIGGVGPGSQVGLPAGGANPFGGELPIALLQQMLGSAGGIV